jgi:DNA-directed RNA polymerase subunit beta
MESVEDISINSIINDDSLYSEKENFSAAGFHEQEFDGEELVDVEEDEEDEFFEADIDEDHYSEE